MIESKLKYNFIDYCFWGLLIVYTNPGGILQALGLISKEGGSVSIRDIFFFMLLGLYILITILDNRKIKDNAYFMTLNFLVLFFLYYFLVFGFIVPSYKETLGYSLFNFIKKSRSAIYSFLLFMMAYRFFMRSAAIFLKTLVVSSITILALFFITVLGGVDILPIEKSTRNFIETDRIFLLEYGLMHILIPIGAVVIVFFKHDFKWKKWLMLVFVMMFMAWVLSITRRRIIGTFIYIFLAIMLFNYFQHKSIISLKKFGAILARVAVIIFIISLTFPKYIDAGYSGIQEAIKVMQTGETSTGAKDNRLGLGKEFMQNLIINNKYFGTGFDNRWRTKEGDEQGFEATDYPLLGAIAMTGMFGLLFFMPIYIILVRLLIIDIKYYRKNRVAFNTMPKFAMLLFMLYFIYHLLQYINWFKPVSSIGGYDWYIYFAMYLASRHLFYKQEKNNAEKEKSYRLDPVI